MTYDAAATAAHNATIAENAAAHAAVARDRAESEYHRARYFNHAPDIDAAHNAWIAAIRVANACQNAAHFARNAAIVAAMSYAAQRR